MALEGELNCIFLGRNATDFCLPTLKYFFWVALPKPNLLTHHFSSVGLDSVEREVANVTDLTVDGFGIASVEDVLN